MQYVVFGANGYIGSYVYQRMLSDGLDVTGTWHLTGGNSNACVQYDIVKDSASNLISRLDDIEKLAVICIAHSNINFCFENSKQAYLLNVIKTKELIH